MILDWINDLFNPYDWVMCVFAWIVTLIVLGVIGAIGYFIWDAWTIEKGPVQVQRTEVIKRYYRASYYTTSYMLVGKVTVPQTVYHPPRYVTVVNLHDVAKEIDSEELYKSDAQAVIVYYRDCTRYGKHVRYEIEKWEI